MKRHTIWSIAIAMFAALSLVSCDKDDKEPTAVSVSVIQNKIRLKFLENINKNSRPEHISERLFYIKEIKVSTFYYSAS